MLKLPKSMIYSTAFLHWQVIEAAVHCSTGWHAIPECLSASSWNLLPFSDRITIWLLRLISSRSSRSRNNMPFNYSPATQEFADDEMDLDAGFNPLAIAGFNHLMLEAWQCRAWAMNGPRQRRESQSVQNISHQSTNSPLELLHMPDHSSTELW